jgi:hypothetical protein
MDVRSGPSNAAVERETHIDLIRAEARASLLLCGRRARIQQQRSPGAPTMGAMRGPWHRASGLLVLMLFESAGCEGRSCKAIGLSAAVRIEVPAEWLDAGTSFRVCADNECVTGLLVRSDGSQVVLGFAPQAPLARTVHLTMAGSGVVTADAEGSIRTHAIYPGCVNAPVAAARYDPTTRTLEQSDWTWDRV